MKIKYPHVDRATSLKFNVLKSKENFGVLIVNTHPAISCHSHMHLHIVAITDLNVKQCAKWSKVTDVSGTNSVPNIIQMVERNRCFGNHRCAQHQDVERNRRFGNHLCVHHQSNGQKKPTFREPSLCPTAFKWSKETDVSGTISVPSIKRSKETNVSGTISMLNISQMIERNRRFRNHISRQHQ